MIDEDPIPPNETPLDTMNRETLALAQRQGWLGALVTCIAKDGRARTTICSSPTLSRTEALRLVTENVLTSYAYASRPAPSDKPLSLEEFDRAVAELRVFFRQTFHTED